MSKKTRSHEHRVEIRTPLERVWQALVDPKDVTNWYVLEARITPGKGGRYWVSFGPKQDGEARIEHWEPPVRLRLVQIPHDDKSSKLSEPIAEEYFLERQGDLTVLRMVQSGIPDTADWDDYFDGTKDGWDLFFAGLGHYLEYHPGQAREQIQLVSRSKGSPEELMKRLCGDKGLCLEKPCEALQAGQVARLDTAGGQRFRGKVYFARPRSLGMDLEELDHAYLDTGVLGSGEGAIVMVTVSVYGARSDQAASLRNHWHGWFEKLFP